MTNRFFFFFVLFLAVTVGGNAQTIFIEDEGIVRVNTSSTDSLAQWEVKHEIAGFIGISYLEYAGEDAFTEPGKSVLTYKVRITTPGTYLFSWHSRITKDEETTEFNDSWVRSPDASMVYGKRDESKVYPHGSDMNPKPKGAGANNWLKAYQNTPNEWFWGAFTNDHEPHDIFMEFNTAGDYTIEIAGRSKGHAIDRFVLVHSTASLEDAQAPTQSESERVGNTKDAKID